MNSRIFYLVSSLLFFVLSASAQNDGAISGTVQDSSGAVVPQASVKLTSHEQGTVRTAQTNSAGVYQFSFLPQGAYDVEIAAGGFKTLTIKDIALATAEELRRDFKLELGNVTENVTVTANAETVNTDNAEVGAVIDNTKVVEMPLNGRWFFSLAVLAPGATSPLNNQGSRGAFSVMGASQTSNNYMLNGMDNNDNVAQLPNFRPAIDAIQEFNILTGIFPAQYGLMNGALVIVSTKSGTNQFHGSGYEFLRNSYMDARNFFSSPGPIPAFKQNQFGATVGGPIIKNKLFFFYSYEGLRLLLAETALTTVPTAAMDNGDFSGLLPKVVVKDPTTGAPFPGNIIPGSRFSPIGVNLLTYYPAPTFPTPAGTAPANNYAFNVPRPERYMQHSVKVDYTISAKDSAFVTINYYKDSSVETGNAASTCNNTTLPEFPCDLSITNPVYGLSETRVFSPTLINEARIAYTETYTPSEARSGKVNFWGPYGVTPLFFTTTEVPDHGIPAMTLTGYNAFPSARSFVRADPHWQTTDTVSLTRGKHTIKIGFNFLKYGNNNLSLGTQGGTLAFTNTSTGPTTSYGLADLLLGLPATSQDAPYVYTYYDRMVNVAAFIQDDYKVSSSLTLNIGLRWEMNTPPIDLRGHITSFNEATGTPVTQSNPAPGAPFYAPVGFGTHPYHFDWHDYAPRFGFAWQPFQDGKTVVRGGGGTFYNNYAVFDSLSALYAGYPYNETYNFTSSLAAPLLLSNPFPIGSPTATITNNLKGADMNFRNATTYEWSLGVQREVAKGIVAEATYFASASDHLQGTHDINQAPPGPGTPAQVQARRPYPLYGVISMYQWDRDARFESLQVRLQKRYSYGLSFLGTYSFGRETDDMATPTNENNYLTSFGLGTIDVRHHISFSPVYELPFGKGKPFLSNGPAALIVGGWQLSSLVQWQTGNPLTATLSGNFSNSGQDVSDRPNVLCNPNASAPRTPSAWFNTACYQVPIASGQPGAQYSFGNEGVGVIETPGLFSVDLSLVRMFQPREWIKIQLRGEAFNSLNHTNLFFPNVVANTAAFGTISSAGNPRQIQVAMKVIF